MKSRNLKRLDATEADTLRTKGKVKDDFNPYNPPFQIADVESTPSHEQMGTAKGSQLDKRVCIHFHSKRRRLADPDGVSCKAAIDGLVQGGILRDDSAHFVKEVSFSQEVSEVEETIIEITWKTKS